MVASQDAEGDRSHWVEGSLDWEDAILEWEETDRVGAEVQWRRGNIALALNPIYGDKTLEKFAERMQVELRRVEEYRQVSKAYEIRVRTRNLSWTHHARIVARPDRLKWLKDADAGEWSVARMLQ